MKTWYVVRSRWAGKEYSPVGTEGPAPHGAVAALRPRCDEASVIRGGREPDERVRARAQALADGLNAGGCARERALRAAGV